MVGTETSFSRSLDTPLMTESADWTTCSVAGIGIELRTRTRFEHERATELNEESAIVEDVIDTVDPDDVFLDIGANIGLYSIFVDTLGATTIGVEPHPANLASLQANLEHNNARTCVIAGALTNTEGEAELYVASDEAGAGTHTFAPAQVSDTTITVPTYTVDGLIEVGDISQPTVVKMDVQGSEYRVLEGMESALANEALRTIYCELHPEQVERIGGSAEGVEEVLTDYGFELTRMVDKADVTWNIKAER